MARKYSYWPIVTALVGAFALFVALPQSMKSFLPSFMRTANLHLGLDLAGGTQLDFRISEEELHAQEALITAEIERLRNSGGSTEEINIARAQLQSLNDQESNVVEAIRTVLERRINALGVSEATITPSYVGNEKHLLVECPGVIDVQECIKVVGKTIQLEFKEQFTEATDEYKNTVRAKARATMARITQSGSTLLKEGENLSTELGVSFQASRTLFRDQLPKGLEDAWTLQKGRVISREGSITQPVQQQDGSIVDQTVQGVFLTELLQPQTQTGRTIQEATKAFQLLATTEASTTVAHHEKESLDGAPANVAAGLRSIQPGSLKVVDTGDTSRIVFLNTFERGGEAIEASHILVSYAGASAAEPNVTRTKEQALARAQELKKQLDAGANFAALARAESDGESRAQGGKLGSITRGVMAPTFEDAAFKLTTVGQTTEPVETQFGYHIIRLDKAKTVTPDKATYEELIVSGEGAAKRAQDIATRLQSGQVKSTEPAVTLRMLFFSLEPTGWKDTTLDGKHFRTATVSVDQVTGIPVVQIVFDTEGGKLFQELTKRNIGKPIAIFVGGELVSAPRVQQEIAGGIAVITGNGDLNEARKLAQDLNTGAIPAPIYLVGQYTVEATLGDVALRTSIYAALLGMAILMVFMIGMYRMLGVMADIALFFYAILLFAILKLPLLLFTHNYIVLTLAGMAGVILSIGMAVDANVLVFERMKEDLRKGKTVKSAVESSFKHAWPAIRDGNVSTLITAAILFIAGTSIVRGFAVTLGMGVLLSMFTAVTVTRWLLRKLAETSVANKPELFGLKKGEMTTSNV
jgi:protein-export membrane protein SecD